MKKIMLTLFGTLFFLVAYGQVPIATEAEAADDTLTNTVSNKQAEFSAARQEMNATKADGDSAYMRNDYAAAIQIYENLLKQGEAAEVYYNLGNSYYKADNIAKAILNYERALLLQPGNADIRANLEIARSKTIDKVTPIPELFFVAWIKALVNCQGIDAWARVGVACFLLFLISLVVFFFSKQVVAKKIGFTVAIIALLMVILGNLFATQQKKRLQNRHSAIVLSPSVTIRSTPSESGTSLFVLHEGYKIEIKDDSMREWKEIRLPDGKVGWIPASAIEVI